MATLRELKGRIGSVASSEKITGAMKMISSAKMHKAEGVLRRLQPFRQCVQTVIGNLLSSDAAVSSPLTARRPAVSRAAIVVLGSDDGLCGAYNVNIFKGLLESIAALRAEAGADVAIEIVPVGKKMRRAVERIAVGDPHLSIAPQAEVDSKSDGDAVKAFARTFEERFLSGELDRVVLQYMHYYSAGRQRLVCETYLPVSQDALAGASAAKGEGRPYLFEPDAATIFGTVLPMYLLSVMQQAFAENRASEQAARVMAMQSANDNAQKLLEQLQLEYNKLRQQGITTELLDIVGGQARD
ncbi:MAG: ATP synthase F1 subunit gamma [Muribaculaceae bacterium]|nr:ATP synthase F1 subunit gamma [Muribaculaceae bacterium]